MKRGVKKVLIETSARHIHLSRKDAELLFGKKHRFLHLKNLSQEGEYSSKDTLSLKGKNSEIKNLRVLMPFRKSSQAEISLTDCYKLGIKPVIRLSGKLFRAPKAIVTGPKASIKIPVIIAKRHLHISSSEAKKLKIKNNQKVSIRVNGLREIIFDNVVVRIGEHYSTALHLDTDEANAAGIGRKAYGELLL